ncbi:MAG: hypothetical protein AAF638_04870 [Pseudomonadota bacterium]
MQFLVDQRAQADGRAADDRADARLARLGTRFLIYPQPPHLAGYSTPETIWISTPLGRVRPGPSDDRVYVIDPLMEKEPYSFPYMPPFVGAAHPPATPGPDGHFDHLDPNSRQFVSAHIFAGVRFVLDLWESYVGHPFVWHFAQTYERLEIIPQVDWYNAQSGFGFMEFGRDTGAMDGPGTPHALNFDVIAHEFGHALIFAEMGMPTGAASMEYFGYHEGMSDLISLFSVLNFDSVLDRFMRGSRGNLLTLNELNRIAELSGDRQIRKASNDRRMGDVSQEVHDFAQPFTGAIFDTLVDMYHSRVTARGLVDLPAEVSYDSLRTLDGPTIEMIGARFAESYQTNHFLLKAALSESRDRLGTALARSWARLEPDGFTLAAGGVAIVDILDEIGDGEAADALMENLIWREIVPAGPTHFYGT